MKRQGESDAGPSTTENDENTEIVHINFVGVEPCDRDRDGILMLLRQLFLQAPVNLSSLTDLIISQKEVTTVIKQDVDVGSSHAPDDDDDDDDAVFGVLSVINITPLEEEPDADDDLQRLLLSFADRYATHEMNEFIHNIFTDGQRIGFLVNERMVNLPYAIALPSFAALCSDIRKGCERNLPYNFDFYVLISKVHKGLLVSPRSGRKKVVQEHVIYANEEERIVTEEADHSFEFAVDDQTDSGNWEGGPELVPFRIINIFRSEKLDSILKKIKRLPSH